MFHGHLLGLYEKALPAEWSWERRLSAARELGFDYMEISIDETDGRMARLWWSRAERKALRELTDRLDMPIRSMCLSAHRRFPFGSADASVRGKARELAEKAVQFADDLGIRVIQLAGYDVYYEPPTNRSAAAFLEGMEYVARLGERYQVMHAMEIMDTPFMNSITKHLWYEERIRSPYYRVYPDLGNLTAWGNDIAAELKKGDRQHRRHPPQGDPPGDGGIVRRVPRRAAGGGDGGFRRGVPHFAVAGVFGTFPARNVVGDRTRRPCGDRAFAGAARRSLRTFAAALNCLSRKNRFMNYYIGLDNGGTLTKAALYTSSGEEVAVCSAATEIAVPHPGYAERDMERMWRTNCDVLRGLLVRAGVDPADVRAVACCGHGKGLYLWGRDGKPVRAGIVSMDNRAAEYARRWEEDGTAAKAFVFSCQRVLACQPVALLAWLRDNEPENYRNIRWVFECKDYVRFRLTGEAFAEVTDYSGTNLMNLHTRDYDPRLLGLFGLEAVAGALPPLRLSTDVCGRITEEAAALTGLKAGTPVVGGMFDIDACAVAVDAADEERVCMIAGTWSINEYISPVPVLDGTVMMNSLFCIPGYYLIEECSPTSAGNNEWFVNTLLPELKEALAGEDGSVYDRLNAMAASLPAGERCPLFLPFLMGSNEQPGAHAAFVGVEGHHGRAHLVRGLYEGVAFSHRRHFDRLTASRRTPVRVIRLAGGVANSEVWTQIFADVMQCPVETVDVGETGTMGCAMAAAVGAGDYPDFASAAASMVKVRRRVEPVAEHAAAYERKYALYRCAVESLGPVWERMAAWKDNE